MSACQAIEFRRPLKSSGILEAAHDYVRNFVEFASEDRIFSEDIQRLHAIIHDFSFVTHCDAFAAGKGINLNAGFEEEFGI
jgi:histidine ammonia-lyase